MGREAEAAIGERPSVPRFPSYIIIAPIVTTGLPGDSMTFGSFSGRGRWISALPILLSLFALSLFLWYRGRYFASQDVLRFEPQLITIAVTFGVFAVNFSFLEYQLSPYKQILRGIAWPHVLSAGSVLLLSLLPVCIAISGKHPVAVSGLIIPLIAFSSIFLAMEARACADPLRRIMQSKRETTVDRFITSMAAAAQKELDEVEVLQMPMTENSPLHEWEFRIPPTITFGDPLETNYAIAAAAIAAGDGRVFDEATEALLRIGSSVSSRQEITLQEGKHADYKVRGMLRQHCEDRLMQLARLTIETDRTERFARSFVETTGSYLREASSAKRQTDEFSLAVMRSLTFIAERALRRGWRTSAIGALVISRECAAVGVHSPPATEYPSLFFSGLIGYARVGQTMGEVSIAERNTEFLYRCLDMLGYLGCSAVKNDETEVGKQCLQSLSQLSRLSRAAKLDCFWTRCGMLPWQHARERVQWMLSWVAKLPTGRQDDWIRSFEEAYSRILGKITKINLTFDGDRPNFRIVEGSEPHISTYMSSDTVSYDYSDLEMLKDLQLY
jgi:hypothetical protein